MSSESASKSEGYSTNSLAYQLERAREELELVSYVTSHDLQTPIRTLQHLCDELSKYPNVTDNKATHELLRNITKETEHMKTLMQGMLDYMRLETYGPAHSLFNSTEVITAALTVLEEKIRVNNARITYDALPEVYGHRGRLTRLFVYLLDNALKFTKPGVPVIQIHMSAIRKGQWVEFCVSDNGIGIEEEYHSIIFGLFSRLHTAEQYPGDGIGLALCRKIVESHGGRIWVESTSEGCRFRFMLPAVPIKP